MKGNPLRTSSRSVVTRGSTPSGFMDGMALSISIDPQYGVPLKVLVDKLTNTRFETPGGYRQEHVIGYM
jgi:hypothetical protein